jgi:type II secretory pathway predicted ATPase ExeA
MYNAHFNFREAPFGVTPDPQFYYSNAIYQEAWATLRYGIEARKGFIVIAVKRVREKLLCSEKPCTLLARTSRQLTYPTL